MSLPLKALCSAELEILLLFSLFLNLGLTKRNRKESNTQHQQKDTQREVQSCKASPAQGRVPILSGMGPGEQISGVPSLLKM